MLRLPLVPAVADPVRTTMLPLEPFFVDPVVNETEPHYIRCVKPNQEKVPDKFSSFLCMQQLR